MPHVLSSRFVNCSQCAQRTQCLIGRLAALGEAPWLGLVRERSVRKDETLLSEGEMPRVFGVIKVGTALLLRQGADGESRPVGIAGRGQALGSTALLGVPAPVSCVTLSPGRLCEVPIEAVRNAALPGPALAKELALEYVRVTSHLADWSQILRLRGIQAQLLAALRVMAQLQQSTQIRLPSQTALAALLGTTRESITRTLRVLESEGCVARVDRWHCQLADLTSAPAVPPARPGQAPVGRQASNCSAGMARANSQPW